MKLLVFFCIGLLSLSTLSFAQESGHKNPVKRQASYTREGSEACLRCHSGDAMRAVASSVHGNMENMYAPLASKGCEACHGPGSIHVSRAHGGAGFPKLIEFGRGKAVSPRESQIEACLTCHHYEKGGTSPIEWYSSSHNRKSINCSTCHKVHVETEPMHVADTQVATCSRCHRKDLKEHQHFEDSDIDWDSLSCGTCHNVHEAFERDSRQVTAEVPGE